MNRKQRRAAKAKGVNLRTKEVVAREGGNLYAALGELTYRIEQLTSEKANFIKRLEVINVEYHRLTKEEAKPTEPADVSTQENPA